MKEIKSFLLIALMLILALAACGGESAANSPATALFSEMTGSERLDTNYAGALSVQAQLALGTMHLDDTNLAVDADLAAELLPLWRAVQSLSSSDNASTVEVNAVVDQIEGMMSTQQINAIAAMELTSDSVALLVENGELQMGPGDQSAAGSEADFTPPDGGMPEAGGPEGGIPGSGATSADLSAEDPAASQAGREGDGFSSFQESALLSATVRLLEVKIS